jgi:CBS domain-containing protein
MDFHALPVVDGGELIGIVTTTDLLRYLSGKNSD